MWMETVASAQRLLEAAENIHGVPQLWILLPEHLLQRWLHSVAGPLCVGQLAYAFHPVRACQGWCKINGRAERMVDLQLHIGLPQRILGSLNSCLASWLSHTPRPIANHSGSWWGTAVKKAKITNARK
uniref:Uncharacterized protein n=1 Tax=Tetraselmis sp. GSL018 TaxID=582737 RepID=A0A061RUU1_9CHLO